VATSRSTDPGASEREVAVRVRAVVAGRVQGVSYRVACADEADRLGVTGWVRNLPDGRVEFAAEGHRRAVDAFVAWAHEGPRWAAVESVDVVDEEPEGLERFVIRPDVAP
jgi:acylphosphatase